MIDPQHITGLILSDASAAGAGGADAGLRNHQGMPMAMHVLLRLAPQVGAVMIHANRNLGAYESFGAAVWPDTAPGLAGLLAGMLAGLEHCETPYLVTVPCDAVHLPDDLVRRLALALTDDTEIAVAAPSAGHAMQGLPQCCLLKAGLAESLLRFTQSGGRDADAWIGLHRCVQVPFDDLPGDPP